VSQRLTVRRFLRRRLRRTKRAWRQLRAVIDALNARLGKGRAHRLPGELIVSLTSYPARFATLQLTLRCLLAQEVRPDRVILWIAHQDIGQLPKSVRRLERAGLEIRSCDELRSFNKLVHALDAFPNAYLVTADDDLHYSRDWLGQLTAAFDPARLEIICHRAHRVMRDRTGALAPYRQWPYDVQDAAARRASTDIMPTGVGGVLYPPRSLHPLVTDRSLFQRLCPRGDDLWFYWCARMAGTPARKIGGKMRLINWPGSQASALCFDNGDGGGNDRMIRALEAELGNEVLGLAA
jgi:hypothetical protein